VLLGIYDAIPEVDMFTISILIRTKNESQYIEQTLRLIAQQCPKPLEVIVVDSGSTDGTVEIVRQRSDVKLIEIPARDFTFGRSLNIGFEIAQGSIVVPLSAHAFPRDSRWLENLTKHFGDPKIAAVYGRQLPLLDAWPVVQRDYLASFGNTRMIQVDADLRTHYRFSNANAAIRRDLWQERRFDESLPAVEDQEWCRSVLRMGYAVVYEPEAAVYHSHNESLLQVYHRTFRESQAYQVIFGQKEFLSGAWNAWRHAVREDKRFVLANDVSRIYQRPCGVP
jgi:rhamnosyltransferase